MSSEEGTIWSEYLGFSKSNIDWCEPNYVHSDYIAEYYNTFSNLLLIIFPMYVFLRNRRSAELVKISFPPKFYYDMFLICLIACGSMFFHSTLTRIGQVFDEVPMLLGSTSSFFGWIWLIKDVSFMWNFLGLGVFQFLLIFIYIFMPNYYALFLISFIIMVWAGFFTQYYIFYKKKKTDRKTLEYHRKYYKYAYIFLSCGLFVWLLDIFACHWVVNFHLHSWWHFLAAQHLYYHQLNYHLAWFNEKKLDLGITVKVEDKGLLNSILPFISFDTLFADRI